ncbi:threonine/serine exporter family protein [Mobiluncus mulieris]|uniref:threonine/serine ThrE exporter family protein n=1 Tax=Mobiluncus mulieris TaxID=2052 RepID=UPI0001BE7BB3|nr:threonine/serine exporter family protein [Mobiluncus mulieris]EEZ91811.1 hypothetical protein HMPREF0578_1053 [Mobiluncus mulieris 28-1]MCV0009684.1 threonine/serine exporter family protein [Mobiluncus mulieris]
MRFKPSETLGHLFASKAKPATNAGDDKDSKPEASPASEVSTEEPPVVLNTQSLLELEQTQITLSEQSRTIMRLGHALQACGASAYRIKISMARLATALGADEHNVQVTFGEISSTVYLPPYSRTAVLEQRAFGTNAAKLDRLRNFVQNLKPGTTIAAANAAMDRIDSYPLEYGKLVNALASGIACACFCFLNRGGLVECLLAGLAAGLGQFMRKLMMTRKFNHFAVWLVAGFAGATFYIIFATLLELILHQCMSTGDLSALPIWLRGDSIGLRSGIVSAVLFLVPGFPLITSMLDLVRMDLSAGIPRFVYTLMLVVSAGVAVWLVSVVFDWAVDPPAQPPIHGVWLFVVRAICSFIASTGFAMLFNCTWRLSIYAGLICGVVNPLRFLAVDNGMTWQLAVGLEALAIGLLADVISRAANFRYSRVSLSVPAAVLMVPGVPLYAALTHLNDGDYSQAFISLTEVSVVILAIGIGLASARMLTDRNWLQDRVLKGNHPVLNPDTRSDYSMR